MANNEPSLQLRSFSSSSRSRGTKKETFEIDRSGLRGGTDSSDDGMNERPPNKEEMTPLGEDLYTFIQIRGAITMHDYMSQALNHGIHGYYQHKEQKIGTEGDFITAPEISQLFGELVAIWCVSVWQAMGSPKHFHLVEMGPGKGTLMKDILTASARFKGFSAAADVHMVELSETMRGLQREKLECVEDNDNNADEPSSSSFSTSSPSFEVPKGSFDENGVWSQTADKPNRWPYEKSYKTGSGHSIKWHSFFSEVPKGPSIYVGQEFLDAFPVHQFAYSDKGWRERMVDIDTSPDSDLNFRVVLAPSATPAAKVLLTDVTVVGRGGTGSGSSSNDSNSPVTATDNFQIGDGLEVCPLAIATAEDIAKRVQQYGGAALFIDYGEPFPQADTLRGFRLHESVNVLSEPGRVDISCDVDFSALKLRAERAGAAVPPIVSQGEWLMRMGIVPRLEMLVSSDKTDEKQAEALVAAAKRLVEPEQMGQKYKVMAITSQDIRDKVDGFPSRN